MNCKQFNSISLEEVLLSLGQFPTKQSEKETWFLNPFAQENHASFKINKNLNYWYLHSEGVGGNNVDFMKKYLNASISEVLVWAEKQNFSSFQNQRTKVIQAPPNYEITEVSEIKNAYLKKYLNERGLSNKIYPFLKEVKFIINKTKLYAIGFQNNSGGWELRNSFYKGSILKKDISLLNLNNENNVNYGNNKVGVFEGFMDALSFLESQENYQGDILVLNSISLLNKANEYLKKYSEINLFFDNDKAGENSKKELLKLFPNANDCSKLYMNHKDFNDYWMRKTMQKLKEENRNLTKENFKMRR